MANALRVDLWSSKGNLNMILFVVTQSFTEFFHRDSQRNTKKKLCETLCKNLV